MADKGQTKEVQKTPLKANNSHPTDFVLEKSIFSNIFEKDIRRVFIYKKAERLAKAIHLITPAFLQAPSLRNRVDAIAVGLIDAAILPPSASRDAFSRELLALSSVLAIARAGNLLSVMNADLISREAHQLLSEIAEYEEPRVFLDDSPTLAELGKQAGRETLPRLSPLQQKVVKVTAPPLGGGNGERRETILSVIKDKGTIYIKDVSTLLRSVSEKTIQRELQKLVQEGVLTKTGSRRWTAYSLAAS